MGVVTWIFFLWTFISVSFMQRQKIQAHSIDQLIQSSEETSHTEDFLQDNGNVKVELDMLFKPGQWLEIQRAIEQEATFERVTGRSRRGKRKAKHRLEYHWTNKVIPYQIAGDTFSSSDRAKIQAAINDWERYTCLDFRQRTSSDRNFISIQNGDGCSSYVGMIGGSQSVSLAHGCRTKGIIIHELGHAIGFHHEQTRPDRDNHVRINFDNIRKGKEFNFQKYPTTVISNYGVSYDYTSVMHYGQYYFSANGKPTIQTIDPSKQTLIGNRDGHSFRDIKLANLMYKCASECGSKKCLGDGFVGEDCKCYCPGSPVILCDGGDGGSTGECQDKHEKCAKWASQGDCDVSTEYMHQYCKVSCDLCDDNGNGGGTGWWDWFWRWAWRIL